MIVVRLLLGLILAVSLAAQEPVAKGWDHFYNLEFDEAITVFSKLASESPKDASMQIHVAQAVLFRAMLKAGALESEMVTGGNSFLRRANMNPTRLEQKQFEDAIASAMRLSEERLARDANDTTGLYDLGVAYALRANYNFLVRKSWTDSLRDATQGRKLHNRLSELRPQLVDARFIQGTHDYIVGSLPWHYKALGFLIGFRGDREQGIRTLQMVAQKGERNRADAKVLLATIYRRESRTKEAVALLHDLIGQFPRNYLFRFELAQMQSDLGNKELALAPLIEVEKLKRAGTPGFTQLPVGKVHYFRGNILFWYRDFDGAIENLRAATSEAAELDLNSAVMSWLRLGQSLDMKGERPKALEAYRHAVAVAPGSEAAKEAEGYLRRAYKRKDD
jgi:tetratricopeptide (TPR) repeat protein